MNTFKALNKSNLPITGTLARQRDEAIRKITKDLTKDPGNKGRVQAFELWKGLGYPMRYTIEVAQNNWTGNSMFLRVDGFKFWVYGYRFRMEHTLHPMNMLHVFSDDGSWPDHRVMSLGYAPLNDMRSYVFNSNGIVRAHEDPFVAAAQILYITI